MKIQQMLRLGGQKRFKNGLHFLLEFLFKALHPVFTLGILLATPWPRRFYEKYRATPLVWLPLFAVFWLCLYLIATGTGNPFLYARF